MNFSTLQNLYRIPTEKSVCKLNHWWTTKSLMRFYASVLYQPTDKIDRWWLPMESPTDSTSPCIMDCWHRRISTSGMLVNNICMSSITWPSVIADKQSIGNLVIKLLWHTKWSIHVELPIIHNKQEIHNQFNIHILHQTKKL